MASGNGADVGGKPNFNFKDYILSYFPLKPITPNNVYYHYIPIAGAISYSAFSVTIYVPELPSRLFYQHSLAVANSLFFNSHLGSGMYMYSRHHLQEAPLYYRIMYSVYGALLFNFGSVLLWAATKTLLPESNILRTFFALSTSFCMLTIGKEYLDYVDSKVSTAS